MHRKDLDSLTQFIYWFLGCASIHGNKPPSCSILAYKCPPTTDTTRHHTHHQNTALSAFSWSVIWLFYCTLGTHFIHCLLLQCWLLALRTLQECLADADTDCHMLKYADGKQVARPFASKELFSYHTCGILVLVLSLQKICRAQATDTNFMWTTKHTH